MGMGGENREESSGEEGQRVREGDSRGERLPPLIKATQFKANRSTAGIVCQKQDPPL